MEGNSNYIVACYFGYRRREFPVYEKDRLCYIKKQIEYLLEVPHSLTEITFVFSLDEKDRPLALEALELIPPQIQGAKCRVIMRENGGFSYGAWGEALNYVENDYYIFNEDDYFFIEPNWDTYLIKSFKTQPNCGAFGMWVRPGEVEHFAHSSFCTSNKIISEIKSKYGGFTFNNQQKTNYETGQENQMFFVQNIIKAGYRLYDIREDYRLNFAMTQIWEHQEGLWIQRLWWENEKSLMIPDIIAWEENHMWWGPDDDRLQKNFRERYPHPNPA